MGGGAFGEGSDGAIAVFSAIAEAMAATREGREASRFDLVREAHMRTLLRQAIAEGCERIAVVCGAYHVPALFGLGDGREAEVPTARGDKALLAGLPRATKATAVALTWVPWTHSRLSYHSGYGAGIASPGWYRHLFESEDHVAARWLAKVAELLRRERFAVSPAHLIEGTRLAEALAALRGRPAPGLAELTEAVIAVLCEGHAEPLGLIQRELVVGEDLGTVPDDAPTVPLRADLTREAKRLRLALSPEDKTHDLDLRQPMDLERSKLFHRVSLLGLDWAVDTGGRGTGTFRETWRSAWEPDYEVRLVEAAVWGNTVATAASAKARADGAEARGLGSLTVLLERCLTADLPDAVGELIDLVKSRAAVEADVTDLASALPPLANVLRYGDVRSTRAETLGPVVEGVAARISIGLPAACAGLDEEAGRAFAPSLSTVQGAIQLLEDPAVREPWFDALRRVADLESANSLLAGRAVRLLTDAGRFDTAAVAARMTRALSRGVEPGAAAGWIEGFLAGSGLVLAHDPGLLGLVDRWLSGLDADRFEEVLPLVRRTFSTFSSPERRTIGELAARRIRTGADEAAVPGEAVSDGAPPLARGLVAGPLSAADSVLIASWSATARATVQLLLTGSGGEGASAGVLEGVSVGVPAGVTEGVPAGVLEGGAS